LHDLEFAFGELVFLVGVECGLDLGHAPGHVLVVILMRCWNRW
jgi:tetrahydromethanopterin S-methyltransferase subunit G